MPENNHVIIIITTVLSNFLPPAVPVPRFNFIDSTQNVLVWATNRAEITEDIPHIQPSPGAAKAIQSCFAVILGRLILTLQNIAFGGEIDSDMSDAVGRHSDGRSANVCEQ